MAPSVVSKRSFVSIEQLDDLPRELGWPLQYRQLEPGSLSSTFTELEGSSWFLMEEQSSRSVEVQAAAPGAMYVLAGVEGNPAVVNGMALDSNHVFVQSPDSDCRVTLPAGIKVTQIGLQSERFEDMISVVAPELPTPNAVASLLSTAPERLARARQAMREVMLNPPYREAAREEAISNILVELIASVFDSGGAGSISSLHTPAANRTLARAKEYIDGHLAEAVRIDALCCYAGTTYRSLERIFAREVGISPKQYVKARRLNAVRRRLLATDPDTGPGVTAVATSHGFTHLGRFAGDYRHYFGESPRKTLLRR